MATQKKWNLPSSLCLGIFLLCIQDCLAVQEFSTEPSYTEVNPGANAKLLCTVNNIGGECRWQKDGKPIGMYVGKYEFSGNPLDGDCSLNVQEVDIKFDDGLWECQVTSSDFQSQDALASKPARLVVREAPKEVVIIHNKNTISPGGEITVIADESESVICESRESNPAALIRWYLGDKELKGDTQKNATEANERHWKATSELRHIFDKSDFGKTLTCRVEHPAYADKQYDQSVVLDIMYKPKVSITRVQDDVLEEGQSSVSLTCTADANPPARVSWVKYGAPDAEPKFVESLEFNPVQRKDSGTYICQAENSIGKSTEEPAEIDVLFAPKILRITPSGGATIGVHNRSILTCSAEGNPTPKYQWLQKLPSDQVLKRGYDAKLVIDDTSYDHQGQYVCEAINMIGGAKKIVRSDPIKMEVRGAPQVLRYSVAKEVEAISGRDVRLEMEVCSDPMPSRTTWDWGSLRVDAGQELHDRYLAEQMVEHPEREDCYIARLVVKNVNPADSRRYFLDVENAHGNDRYAVALTVKDPVSMASVIGVVIALLALFVVLVIILLYAYKKQKLCFKDGSKSAKNIDSNGFDPEKSNGRPTNGHLSPDALYHLDKSVGLENGAMTDKL